MKQECTILKYFWAVTPPTLKSHCTSTQDGAVTFSHLYIDLCQESHPPPDFITVAAAQNKNTLRQRKDRATPSIMWYHHHVTTQNPWLISNPPRTGTPTTLGWTTTTRTRLQKAVPANSRPWPKNLAQPSSCANICCLKFLTETNNTEQENYFNLYINSVLFPTDRCIFFFQCGPISTEANLKRKLFFFFSPRLWMFDAKENFLTLFWGFAWNLDKSQRTLYQSSFQRNSFPFYSKTELGKTWTNLCLTDS